VERHNAFTAGIRMDRVGGHGAIFVFIADLIGNTLNFESRFINAFTTTIVFAVAFAFYLFPLWERDVDGMGVAVMNPTP
jgi:hypothetical protein